MSQAMGCAAALLFLSLANLPARATEDNHGAEEAQAVAAAEKWLALIDQQSYAEGWQSAAGYLKGAVSQEDFVKSLNAARKPLGALKSRAVSSKQFRTTLPGAPDGKYVVIQFQTEFAGKQSAVETVTPMLDDGDWRVSGYYIK